MTFRIGLLVFPDIMQLDMTDRTRSLPRCRTPTSCWCGSRSIPVRAGDGLRLLPDATFADCPQLDLICVPGGAGMNALLTDEETLGFLRRQAEGARYVTSVCTGSLVLGAAGLLRGKRSACHWMSRDMLARFGAIPDGARVVKDGKFISGGGVTAGIDFALAVAAELLGEETAKAIQLAIEYDPAPPFDAGSPDRAGAEIEQAARDAASARQAERLAAVEKAAARL